MPEKFPDFVEHGLGTLTEAGKQLQLHMESLFVEADATNDMVRINNLGGSVGHYYLNVYKLKSTTPERWMKECTTYAQNVWRDKLFLESQREQTETVAETAAKTNDLEAQFNTFKESLEAQIIGLKAENEALHNEISAMKATKRKPTKPDPEPQTDDADATEEVPETEA